MRYAALGAVALLALSGCSVAGTQPSTATAPAAGETEAVQGDVPAKVREEMANAIKAGAPGMTAIVMRDGKQLFRIDMGKIAPDAELPIASASKWFVAALTMTVVDEGKLSLDVPISKYLPEFKGEAGKTTLRQLLAQTAGEGSLMSMADVMQDPRITLAQSAAEVAKRPLVDKPGTVFKYGGPGFQVAGALVEQATGKRWADLFNERIAKPLGMKYVAWTHIPARGVSPAETLNPLLQGGAVTNAEDYMRFLTMIAQHGVYDGKRILSAKAVDEMESVQTLGKPMAWLPPGVPSDANMQYALGNWCERWGADGQCTSVSSPGMYGTYPWIDRTDGLYGIFFTKDRLTHFSKNLRAAREAIITAYKEPGSPS